MISDTALIHPQSWKLRAIGVVGAGFGAAMFWPHGFAEFFGLDYGVVAIGSVLGVAVTFAVAVAALRCPACGLSLFWYAVTRNSIGAWLRWLVEAKACPRCHYPGQ